MDTTQSMRTSVDFPQSLRPLSLTSVSSESLEHLGCHRVKQGKGKEVTRSGQFESISRSSLSCTVPMFDYMN